MHARGLRQRDAKFRWLAANGAHLGLEVLFSLSLNVSVSSGPETAVLGQPSPPPRHLDNPNGEREGLQLYSLQL